MNGFFDTLRKWIDGSGPGDVSRWMAFCDDACPTVAPGPEMATAQARLLAEVEAALASLPAAHREVLLEDRGQQVLIPRRQEGRPRREHGEGLAPDGIERRDGIAGAGQDGRVDRADRDAGDDGGPELRPPRFVERLNHAIFVGAQRTASLENDRRLIALSLCHDVCPPLLDVIPNIRAQSRFLLYLRLTSVPFAVMIGGKS